MNPVDVVVVNYKTSQHLSRFLESLKEQSSLWKDGSTLTVCNVCPETDDLAVTDAFIYGNPELESMAPDPAGAFRRGEHPGVVHQIFETNVGYATACNTGAALGSNPTIALFNADVILPEGSLARCVDALHSKEDWGILGPRQTNSRGLMTAAGIFGPRERPEHRGWMKRDSQQWQDIRDDCPTVAGSAYLVKRRVWDELTACPAYQEACAAEGLPAPNGAFWPSQHFYEETLCSYHAIQHGYKVVYYGPVKVVHEWHVSAKPGSLGGVTKGSRKIFRALCDRMGIPRD